MPMGPSTSSPSSPRPERCRTISTRRRETQLADVLEAAQAVDPLFVGQAAVFARTRGAMKDMPALLAA